MSVRVHNAGASAQNRYAFFMLPKSRGDTLGEVVDCTGGATATAYRHHILSHTPELATPAMPLGTPDGNAVMYVVKSNWAAGATSLTLAAGTPAEAEFELHEAYGTSECGEIIAWGSRHIPRAYCITGNNIETEIAPGIRGVTPTFRIKGTHCIQAIWEVHSGGWHVRHAATFTTGEAVSEFSTSFMWSDETVTSGWSVPCTGIRLKYDYDVKLKFAANEGYLTVNTSTGATSALTGSDRNIQFPTTFENGDDDNDRYSWAGRFYHGRRIGCRGWMLGQVGAEVPADRDLFTATAFLNGVGDATEWANKFQFSGTVGPVPVNPTSLNRPAYATTSKHFVSWNRGTSMLDTDFTFGTGHTFPRYGGSPGSKGNLIYHDGSSVIRGYEELYDFECASADYGLRPAWVRRNGTRYPVLPWTGSGNNGGNMALHEGYPHNPGQFSNFNFGRSNSDTATKLPSSNNNNDAMDTLHTMSGSIAAYYQLAKWDDYAYTMLIDWTCRMVMNTRRDGIYSGGYGASEDREVGRLTIAALQPGKVLPELRGIVLDFLHNPSGSIGRYFQSIAAYRQNTTWSGPGRWNKFDTVSPTVVINGSANTGTDEAMGSVWEAVKITTPARMRATAFEFRVKASATLTNPSATLTGYIYTNNAGVPGTLVSTLGTLSYGSITTSYAAQWFYLSTHSAVLTTATDYWFVIKQSAAPTGGTISLDSAATGTGKHAFSANGTSWTAENSKTLWYKIYAPVMGSDDIPYTEQVGPLWQGHTVVGTYALYLLTGDDNYREMAMTVGQSIFLHGWVILQSNYGAGTYVQFGKQITAWMMGNRIGQVPTAAQRTSGPSIGSNPDFDILCGGSVPGGGFVGDAFRGWAYPVCKFYQLLGENAEGRAHATDCLRSILRSQTDDRPRGWAQSGWHAFADMVNKKAEVLANGFGWGD